MDIFTKQKLENDKFFDDYNDALWGFMLEHSNIGGGGNLFVRFGVSSKENFLKRIRARYLGYMRVDDRYGKGLTPQEKNEKLKELNQMSIQKSVDNQYKSFRSKYKALKKLWKQAKVIILQ